MAGQTILDQNAPDQIHLTVATVVEKDGTYLCVSEYDNGKLVYNQPAGHVEPGEELTAAARRETLEETGWHVELTGFMGITTYKAPGNGVTYYRVCFAGKAKRFDPDYVLDADIEEAVWLSYEELLERRELMRSPLVLQALENYRDNRVYSLSLATLSE
ncbi:NUDIX hydrolase [Porticoccus sp. W117]|uniref:NUDIX hydrolase n=1 Tax=Porticoccus sp. W117 TaxID=3054777 RepID=UPI0025935F41|nr:NUDIX hydrolase [Porticoccus sp. W117]MDM3871937.1 NUDIX hydrolase [Porticoccus sp. W117]